MAPANASSLPPGPSLRASGPSSEASWTAVRAAPVSTFEHGIHPSEVTIDRAATYPACSTNCCPPPATSPSNTPITPSKLDHGRLKSRLRTMRGRKRPRSTQVISAGHTFVQNLRRGHYELGMDEDPQHRLPGAFAELALAI
jgi:IS6 family transposase